MTPNQEATLRAALRFYARREHVAGFETWEGPSGEDNWLCPPSEDTPDFKTFIEDLDQHMVEDGGVARSALKGVDVDFEADQLEPIEGEAPAAALDGVTRSIQMERLYNDAGNRYATLVHAALALFGESGTVREGQELADAIAGLYATIYDSGDRRLGEGTAP